MKTKKQYKSPLEVGQKGQRVINIIMVILSLIVILPVLLVYIISFSSEKSLAEIGYSFIPKSCSLKVYKYYFNPAMGEQLLRSYGLTIFVAVTGTVLAVLMTTMFAYAISRKNFKLKSILSFFIFFTMLFKGGLVPSYIINTKYLHLNDTVFILIIMGMFSPFNTIILRTFITSCVPDSIIESAKIDGAREWTILQKIVMPLSKPGIAAIGFFYLINYWNDWFTGLIYIMDSKLVTLQYFMMKIMNNIQFIKDNSRLSSSAEGRELLKSFPTEAGRMALVVIVMTPMLCCYPFFQKYFIKGLTVGGVKG